MQDIAFSSPVPKAAAAIPLLEYLSARFTYLSREQWLTAIEQGRVELDSVVAGPEQLLRPGQALTFYLDYQSQLEREGQIDTRWQLVWQNAELMVVYKPAGMPVSRTGEVVINNLINLVRSQSGYPNAQLINRLDSETSGLLVLAKDKHSAKYWQPKIEQLIVGKYYLALAYGHIAWHSYDHSCRLGKSLDHKDPSFNGIRCQMHLQPYPHGKFCRAKFQRLAHGQIEGQAVSLVQVQLLTGRQHQIRAQLKSLGHSLVGDKIYSHAGQFYLKRLQQGLKQADLRALLTPHHCLSAQRLILDIDGERVEIDSPHLPDYYTAV